MTNLLTQGKLNMNKSIELLGIPTKGVILLKAHGDIWSITETISGNFMVLSSPDTGSNKWDMATAKIHDIYDALNIIIDDNPHPEA